MGRYLIFDFGDVSLASFFERRCILPLRAEQAFDLLDGCWPEHDDVMMQPDMPFAPHHPASNPGPRTTELAQEPITLVRKAAPPQNKRPRTEKVWIT